MKLKVRLAAGVVLAALAFGFHSSNPQGILPAAHAQNFGQRVVTGSVLDADSSAIGGAIVFLRNAKNKSIRSYTSTKDGRFRFTQVNMSEDFDLWAEKDGKKSPSKTVSSWDTRKEAEYELRIK